MDLASNRTAKAIARGNTMKRRISFTLLAAACASLPLALAGAGEAHAQSVMRPANSVVLSIGRGQLVSVPGAMADVFVANDAVADVQIRRRTRHPPPPVQLLETLLGELHYRGNNLSEPPQLFILQLQHIRIGFENRQ